jgi:ribosomal protein L21E
MTKVSLADAMRIMLVDVDEPIGDHNSNVIPSEALAALPNRPLYAAAVHHVIAANEENGGDNHVNFGLVYPDASGGIRSAIRKLPEESPRAETHTGMSTSFVMPLQFRNHKTDLPCRFMHSYSCDFNFDVEIENSLIERMSEEGYAGRTHKFLTSLQSVMNGATVLGEDDPKLNDIERIIPNVVTIPSFSCELLLQEIHRLAMLYGLDPSLSIAMCERKDTVVSYTVKDGEDEWSVSKHYNGREGLTIGSISDMGGGVTATLVGSVTVTVVVNGSKLTPEGWLFPFSGFRIFREELHRTFAHKFFAGISNKGLDQERESKVKLDALALAGLGAVQLSTNSGGHFDFISDTESYLYRYLNTVVLPMQNVSGLKTAISLDVTVPFNPTSLALALYSEEGDDREKDETYSVGDEVVGDFDWADSRDGESAIEEIAAIDAEFNSGAVNPSSVSEEDGA